MPRPAYLEFTDTDKTSGALVTAALRLRSDQHGLQAPINGPAAGYDAMKESRVFMKETAA